MDMLNFNSVIKNYCMRKTKYWSVDGQPIIFYMIAIEII